MCFDIFIRASQMLVFSFSFQVIICSRLCTDAFLLCISSVLLNPRIVAVLLSTDSRNLLQRNDFLVFPLVK